MNILPFKKSAFFTDIHYGRKNSSEIHTKDCNDFMNFFINNVKKDPLIDSVFFLGDWFDNRNKIDISVLHHSYESLSALNDLGIPCYFLIGNHCLYQKYSRNIYALEFAKEFENFTIISEPTEIDINGNKTLLLPYIFPEEYPRLMNKISNSDLIFGHLELKGFKMTGDYNICEHGLDLSNIKRPKKILSGHFHARQFQKNIHYIGNCFPMDFSDEGDSDRGMATYDYLNDKLEYINWKECPSYLKTKLSELLENYDSILKEKMTVNCLIDEDLSFEESIKLKEKLMKKYKLRSFNLVEQININKDVQGDVDVDLNDMSTEPVDTIVKNVLKTIKIDGIDNEKLQKIYGDL